MAVNNQYSMENSLTYFEVKGLMVPSFPGVSRLSVSHVHLFMFVHLLGLYHAKTRPKKRRAYSIVEVIKANGTWIQAANSFLHIEKTSKKARGPRLHLKQYPPIC